MRAKKGGIEQLFLPAVDITLMFLSSGPVYSSTFIFFSVPFILGIFHEPEFLLFLSLLDTLLEVDVVGYSCFVVRCELMSLPLRSEQCCC